MKTVLILLSILFYVLPVGAANGELPALRRNPFYHPPLALVAIPSEPQAEMPVPEEVKLELRATLLGTASAMADISGAVLLVGEETEGFRLVRIAEDEVVMEKNGKQIVLSLGPEE